MKRAEGDELTPFQCAALMPLGTSARCRRLALQGARDAAQQILDYQANFSPVY